MELGNWVTKFRLLGEYLCLLNMISNVTNNKNCMHFIIACDLQSRSGFEKLKIGEMIKNPRTAIVYRSKFNLLNTTSKH